MFVVHAAALSDTLVDFSVRMVQPSWQTRWLVVDLAAAVPCFVVWVGEVSLNSKTFKMPFVELF